MINEEVLGEIHFPNSQSFEPISRQFPWLRPREITAIIQFRCTIPKVNKRSQSPSVPPPPKTLLLVRDPHHHKVVRHRQLHLPGLRAGDRPARLHAPHRRPALRHPRPGHASHPILHRSRDFQSHHSAASPPITQAPLREPGLLRWQCQVQQDEFDEEEGQSVGLMGFAAEVVAKMVGLTKTNLPKKKENTRTNLWPRLGRSIGLFLPLAT